MALENNKDHNISIREWSQAVRQRDNHQCQKCGAKNGIMHAHHIATRSRRPDLKTEISNGLTVCKSCHSWIHNNPKEAENLGLLKEASYELAKLLEQREKMHLKKGDYKNCEQCNKEFYRMAHQQKQRFCSIQCAGLAKRRVNV